MLAGFVIGQGAVTVIDWHGFLGRKSGYWTEATTRTHKVTKPLIWLGLILSVSGGIILYREETLRGIPLIHLMLAGGLVLNGCWLSFKVSPYLLKRESAGQAAELLPQAWQRKIMLSFFVSVFGWWGSLFLLAYYLIEIYPVG